MLDGAPRAMVDEVGVKELPEDLLVYDLAQQRAHGLNRVAAAVWRRCDGTRSVAAITAAVHADGVPVPEAAVRYALDRLGGRGS